MANNKLSKFKEYTYKNKYEILFVSFLILIFGDVFFPPEFDETPILVIQNVFASNLLFHEKKRWRLPLFLLLATLIVLEVIKLIVGFSFINITFDIIYVLYFVLLSIEVYSQILKAKEVTFSVVAAVLCGFIILSLIGGYTFIIIEVLHTGSFRNLTADGGGIVDLVYFSFITVLSIGFGDITPVSSLAKNVTVFFGLIGNFYSVVVIGIIIGKYSSKK